MTRRIAIQGRGWFAVLGALGFAAGATPARAFLGIGDTSFVTVIANPAEAANWAAQARELEAQLEGIRGTVAGIETLQARLGDPGAAVASLPSLSAVLGPAGSLAGSPATATDLQGAWDAEGGTAQTADETTLLARIGSGSTMAVAGVSQPRNPALYSTEAEATAVTAAARVQIVQEQAARVAVLSGLAQAWKDYGTAQTESRKQAVLTEISQLLAESQVLDGRRHALLDDLTLADRQARTNGDVRATAADESSLAESAALTATLAGRVQAGEAQRAATLEKPVPAPAASDYSALKVWTPADTAGGGP